jgi:hypothetical protein
MSVLVLAHQPAEGAHRVFGHAPRAHNERASRAAGTVRHNVFEQIADCAGRRLRWDVAHERVLVRRLDRVLAAPVRAARAGVAHARGARARRATLVRSASTAVVLEGVRVALGRPRAPVMRATPRSP